jgi:hypothetical protein
MLPRYRPSGELGIVSPEFLRVAETMLAAMAESKVTTQITASSATPRVRCSWLAAIRLILCPRLVMHE